MKILLFGATGMVGKGALLEALDDPAVDVVTALVRKPTGVTHAKLTEVVHGDFADYGNVSAGSAADVAAAFVGVDACLFCLGISSAGMKEAAYTKVTRDTALAAGRMLKDQSPDAVFCFISGEGTDANSKTMWSRVKGQTENALLALFPGRSFMFRPGYIHPERGVAPASGPIKLMYAVLGPLRPALQLVASSHMTTSTTLGRALLKVAHTKTAPKAILQCPEINALGATAAR